MKEGLLQVVRDTRRAIKEGPTALEERQRARCAGMVAHARAHSPYYRDLYTAVTEGDPERESLPITNKNALMARFDEWVTDRDVTLAKAQVFAADPALIGERFLGRYTLVTTSGTTGVPGIFVVDDRAMRITSALMLRMLQAWVGASDVARILARGRRLAMVADLGHHSATSVAAARLVRSAARSPRIQLLSVRTPLPQLVAQLNAFRPTLLAPYASMGRLLASEQEAGRLQIEPVLIALAAEGLPIREYDSIARTFQAKVGNSYAATECPFLSYDCSERWLHVNTDWVVLEPVDSSYQPVAPGTQSHTVLLSNLANRVQPILRYDLGDSVLERPDPCPCGNPLPAIRVQGRSADVLSFRRADGEMVSIAPLAFEIDHIPGIEQFQIVQTAATGLSVRLRITRGIAPDRVWQATEADIKRVLTQHGLDNVTIQHRDEPPQQSAGGKYRTVVPLQQ